MIKESIDLIKKDTKFNLLFYVVFTWLLYVSSVSGDASDPMNNGIGFISISIYSISFINASYVFMPSKTQIMKIFDEENKTRIPNILFFAFLLKTLILYLLMLMTWILHIAFNHQTVMILPASIMFWFGSSISGLLYYLCLFISLYGNAFFKKRAFFPLSLWPFVALLELHYSSINYRFICEYFSDYGLWIFLLFLFLYFVFYSLLKIIIKKSTNFNH